MINLDDMRTPLIKGLKTHTAKPVIMQDAKGKQPPYPFTTIKVTLAGQTTHRAAKIFNSVVEKITESQDVELVVSVTSYSENEAAAHDLAQRCREYLLGRGKLDMEDAGIVVVDVEEAYSRDVFLTIEHERRYGFDLRLRTRSNVVYEIEVIENIDLKGDKITWHS